MDKETHKKTKTMKEKIIVTVCLLLITVVLMYQQQRIDQEKQKAQEAQQLVQQLQTSLDSIDQEMLPLQIEIGRYEVALSILKDLDPKAAEKYEMVLSKYTE